MVPDSASPDDFFIVFQGNKAELEGAPEFDANMEFEATAPAADANNTTMATAPAANTDLTAGVAADGTMADGTVAPGTTAEGTMATEPVANTNLTEGVAADGTMADGTMVEGDMVDYAMMTEGDLVGQRVYGPNGEDVGEISAVTIGADNMISAAVIDVGGFLGMGEKPVALSADMLRMVPNTDGNGTMLRVSMTQEQMEALPTYKQ
jgi:hypothetical protein